VRTNTVANERITETAQTAAESVAEAVGSFLSNETVASAIDRASDFYRKNPLASKIGIAVAVAAVATVIARSARR
jgi:hypothetical protein